MPALAMTDHGNVFGAYDFYAKAKSAGLKPIIGMEAYVAGPKGRQDRSEKVAQHLILVAKNAEGYANLEMDVARGERGVRRGSAAAGARGRSRRSASASRPAGGSPARRAAAPSSAPRS